MVLDKWKAKTCACQGLGKMYFILCQRCVPNKAIEQFPASVDTQVKL